MNKSLAKKLKTLPKNPGVYLFKDKTGRILYIGKAANIKNRVRSHFVNSADILKGKFLKNTRDIDWMETDDEKQAFILENELIKKYKPRYNIQWRDDKSYFWVALTKEEWPRIKVAHQTELIRHPELVSGSKNKMPKQVRHDWEPIGPFTNGTELRSVLRALRRIFPYRTCKNPYNKPCLQWHLGLCPAHGNSESSIKNQELRKYQNSLNSLRQFLRLYAGEPIRIEAYDISNIHGNWATGSMIVFRGAKPDKSQYRKFKIRTVRGANDVAMVKEILRRRLNHPEWPLPDLMLIDGGITQLRAAQLAYSQWRIANSKNSNPKLLTISYKPIATISLAKREEEIYTEYSNKPLRLRSLPLDFRLVFQAIRNEAHRFAIFYYRHLHGKQFRGTAKTS